MTKNLGELIGELSSYADELARIEAYRDDRTEPKFWVTYSYNTYSDRSKGFVIDEERLKALGFDVDSLRQQILAAEEKYIRHKIQEIANTICGLI